MSLKVNLRRLEAHEIHLQGELPVADLDFDLRDEMIRAEKSLIYDLTAEKLDDAVLVQGKLELTLDCECVRCLKSFRHKLNLPHWTAHLLLAGEDRVSIEGDSVDLTPFVREDMLLEFPRHPLCKPECAGLKQKARKTSSDEEVEPGVWAELNKLKQ
jgi:uncharacterized protein